MRKLFAPAFFAATLSAIKVSTRIRQEELQDVTDVNQETVVIAVNDEPTTAGEPTTAPEEPKCGKQITNDCREDAAAMGLPDIEWCYHTSQYNCETEVEELCKIEIKFDGDEFNGNCQEVEQAARAAKPHLFPAEEPVAEQTTEEPPVKETTPPEDAPVEMPPEDPPMDVPDCAKPVKNDCAEEMAAFIPEVEWCKSEETFDCETGMPVTCFVDAKFGGVEFLGDCDEMEQKARKEFPEAAAAIDAAHAPIPDEPLPDMPEFECI